MPTTRVPLTSSWVALGSAPLFVELLSVSSALISCGSSSPSASVTDGVVMAADRLASGNFGAAGETVYARAVDTSATIVCSASSLSSSGGGGGAVTIADGADAAEGAKADAAATNSTSSWSVISLLKGIYAASTAPTPAGTNAIGSVSVVDGGDASQGAKADAAANNSTSSWSVISLLKGLYAAMVAATPAGEAHIGEVGGNVAKGQVQFGPASSTTYTAGQCMAVPQKIAGMSRVNNGSGILTFATLELAAANTNQVDVFVFSASPSGSYAAGSTFTLNSADRTKLVTVLQMATWVAAGASDSLGKVTPSPEMFSCDDGTDRTALWFLPVARGSITLASATDATLTVRPARN